jgi:6-phosphogluconolactonase
MRVYVGTYTGGDSKGIYTCDYDPETGRLDVVGTTESENPSFLAMHPSGDALYAVNENSDGGVSTFAVEQGSGALRLIASCPTHGSAPCHLCVHPDGDALYTANYTSGTLSAHPIGADLRPGAAAQVIRHEGNGPHPGRQQGPHAHSINVDPQGRFAYTPDLGIDRVMIYRITADRRLEAASPPWAQLPAGSGPRHFAFHPGGGLAYVINELASTVVSFRRSEATGALEEIASVSTLPEEFAGESTCADIHMDPSGTRLYGSNRGHDSIAIFRAASDGALDLIGHQGEGIAWPRNFAVAPDGRFLLVANRHDDSITCFALDSATGFMRPAGMRSAIPDPVCVIFVDPV